jgi:ABC-type branched-subunit amino acid transport system substrate-binding protein
MKMNSVFTKVKILNLSLLKNMMIFLFIFGNFTVSYLVPAQKADEELVNSIKNVTVMIFPLNEQGKRDKINRSSGTLVSSDGFIVASLHGIRYRDNGEDPPSKNQEIVIAGDAKIYTSKFVSKASGCNRTANDCDISILKIEDKDRKFFPFATLGDSRCAIKSDTVISVGFSDNSYNYDFHRIGDIYNETLTERGDRWILVDGLLLQGQSGGGTFSKTGKLIGVNNGVGVSSSYARSIYMARNVLNASNIGGQEISAQSPNCAESEKFDDNPVKEVTQSEQLLITELRGISQNQNNIQSNLNQLVIYKNQILNKGFTLSRLAYWNVVADLLERNGENAGKVKIGVILPISRDYIDNGSGLAVLQGASLALEESNCAFFKFRLQNNKNDLFAKSIISTCKSIKDRLIINNNTPYLIVTDFRNHDTEPNSFRSTVQNFQRSGDIVAILGPYLSKVLIPNTDLFLDNTLGPVIVAPTTTSSDENLSKEDKIFRVTETVNTQAAKLINEKMYATDGNILGMYDPNEPYLKSFYDSFSKLVQTKRLLVLKEPLTFSTGYLKDTLKRSDYYNTEKFLKYIQDNDIKQIFLAGFIKDNVDLINIFSEIKETDYRYSEIFPQIFSGNASYQDKVLTALDSSGLSNTNFKLTLTTFGHWSQQANSDYAKRFCRFFRGLPNPNSMQGYDGMVAIYEAIKKAGAFPSIKNEIRRLIYKSFQDRDFKYNGITGKMKFDANGDIESRPWLLVETYINREKTKDKAGNFVPGYDYRAVQSPVEKKQVCQ